MSSLRGDVARPSLHRRRQVALILDASKPYDRKVIRGVAAFAREAGNWSLYVEEDPLQKLPDLRQWDGQGILANFDDRRVAAAVREARVPVVGLGGGFGWYDRSRHGPYLATDSEAIAALAFEHLVERGFRRLAYCGLPATRTNGWSRIRGLTFTQKAAEAGLPCWSFTGRHATVRRWRELQDELCRWIATLPRPIGLMACNDARARHVLEACRTLGVPVPEEIAVVGVDNDETIAELSDPPLSSVDQGAHRLGYQAAALLERIMSGRRLASRIHYLAPQGVVTRQSTDVLAVEDPEIAAALRFIRGSACDGIGVGAVVAAVGGSRSTLERRFRAVLRRTIHAEIERVRIEQAKELLQATDWPIKQVAARTGFRHLTYLNRLFRQRVGQTPAAFRRLRAAAVGTRPASGGPPG